MSADDAVDPELVDMMTSVFADRKAPAAADDDPGTLDRAFWGQLESLGLTRLTCPESRGGSGASWRESAVLLATAAAHAVSVPLAEHDLLAGWLLTEAGHAVDTNMRTACTIDAQGTARAVPWARAVDRITVLYHNDRAWRVADIPVADAHVVAGQNVAGEPRDEVTIESAQLDGTPVDSRVAEQFLLRGALARAVQTCGAMEKIVELCVTHTTERQQFGRALAKFQAVQHLVADAAAECCLARSATDAAIHTAARDDCPGDALTFAIAVAKSCTGHAASVVARNAHQVHGAIGTTFEHELHKFTNPAMAWRSEFGTLHHWDQLLTTRATHAAPEALWPMIASGGETRPTPRQPPHTGA